MSNNILNTEILSLLEIYNKTKELNNSKEEIEISKKIKIGIKNFIKQAKFITGKSKDVEGSHLLLNIMVYEKDFELMEVFAEKVEYSSFFKLLDPKFIDLTKKENQDKIFDVLKKYKKTKNDIPFKCNLIKYCYIIKENYKNNESIDKFILEIFKINENKYPLRESLDILNGQNVEGYNNQNKIDLKILTHVVLLSMIDINIEKLKSNIGARDFDNDYKNVNKEIIEKIKEKLNYKKNKKNINKYIK